MIEKSKLIDALTLLASLSKRQKKMKADELLYITQYGFIVYTYGCSASVPFDTDDFSFDLSYAVDFPTFFSCVKNLPTKEITITVDESINFVILKGGKTKYSVAIFENEEINRSIEEYGAVPEDDEWKSCPELFNPAISTMLSVCSKNYARGTLTCLNITPEGMEATDGSQLLIWGCKLPIKSNILLSADIVSTVIPFMDKICVKEEWVWFRSNLGDCQIKQVEGRFPDLHKIMNSFKQMDNTTIQINTDMFNAAIKRAQVVKPKYGNSVYLDIKKDKAKLWRAERGGSFSELLPFNSNIESDSKVSVAVNLNYLNKAMEFNSTELHIDSKNHKLLVAEGNFIYVAMLEAS